MKPTFSLIFQNRNSKIQSYKAGFNQQPYNLISDQIIEYSSSNRNVQNRILHDNNLDFFIQDISPKNPFLPREEIVVVTPSRKDSQIFNNLLEYSILNQSLDHQDQAKINRAYAMGWLPKNVGEQMRNNKSKQQLYREELEQQILQKEIEKKKQTQLMKYEDEKYERNLLQQLNSPKNFVSSPSSLSIVKEYPDKRLLTKTPSKLRRTPPNSLRKDIINHTNLKHEEENKQQIINKNNGQYNNMSVSQSPSLKYQQFPPSPQLKYQQYPLSNMPYNKSPTNLNNKAIMVMAQHDFNSEGRDTSLLPQYHSELSLNFMKRQMQESYVNASKQLDELKIEMEKIKESKQKAQQEFNQLRNDIRSQIQHHNIKVYGGINFIKNPSKYYSMENLLTNNDVSLQQPFLLDTTSDQNLLQYSQSILSSGLQRQSAIQSPELPNISIKNKQLLNTPDLLSKDTLVSKTQIEQDTIKGEQILNESQLSKISQKSKQSNQSLNELKNKNDMQENIKVTSKSQIKSDNKLANIPNDEENKQNEKANLKNVNEIDLAQSNISVNSPLFNYKPKAPEEQKGENQQSKENENSIKKEENQSNFIIKKVQNVKSRPSLEIHKDMQQDANRRQQLNDQMNLYNSNNRKQEGEKDFKVLIKNIEEIVEEQGKEINQINKQQKKQIKQNIEFVKTKKQQK